MNTNNQNIELRNIVPFSHFEDTVNIRKILGDLYQSKGIILFVSFFTLMIAFFYTFTIRPSYRTSALIQIDTQSGNNIVNSLGLKSTQSSPSETELALLRTSYILEPVIREHHLNIAVSAHYFPIFGEWMARRYEGHELAKPFFGLKFYAWGGEKIDIKYFLVPPQYEGEGFRLIAEKNNTYKIYYQNNLILTGKPGQRVSSYAYPRFAIYVTTLKAHPGTEFALSSQIPNLMVGQLASQLKIKRIESDINSNPNENTGVIQLEFTGPDPDQIKRILNAIVDFSVKKNVQLKAREAQKTLNFLYGRLPELKKGLESSENILNQYHAKKGTFSMLMTSQFLMKQLNGTSYSLEQLKTKKEELLQIYTSRYPNVIALDHQQLVLENKLKEIKKEITSFPAARQEELNFERDVKIKTKMYETLLNDMYRLEIIKAGLVGDIVSLDKSVLSIREPSHKLRILLMGFLIGLWISAIAIIIKTFLTKTIDDTNQLENELQIPIKAVVPFSNKQKQLERISKKGKDIPGDMSRLPLVLAHHDPKDISVEGLQSLRISLYITNATSHNVIAIMGSLGGIGKSFVSLNLACILADSGKRTLLIDADIRKGRLHRSLFQSKIGLSEYLAGSIDFENAIRQIHNNLYFIPCGKHIKHPLDLLKSSRLNDLIQRARGEFDQVIIDTSPILPVIDAILIAKYCDTKLFVVGGASDQFDNVKEAVKKVQAHGITIDGFVFNHQKRMARYGSKYGYYRYAYGT